MYNTDGHGTEKNWSWRNQSCRSGATPSKLTVMTARQEVVAAVMEKSGRFGEAVRAKVYTSDCLLNWCLLKR